MVEGLQQTVILFALLGLIEEVSLHWLDLWPFADNHTDEPNRLARQFATRSDTLIILKSPSPAMANISRTSAAPCAPDAPCGPDTPDLHPIKKYEVRLEVKKSWQHHRQLKIRNIRCDEVIIRIFFIYINSYHFLQAIQTDQRRNKNMSTRVYSVSPQRLHRLQSEGHKIDLIDVRTPAEYRSGHATGAKLVPLDELSPERLAAEAQNPGVGRDQPLYLTCLSGLRAQQAAERLMAAGYPNLTLLEGGTEAWEKAGLPMQRCAKTISLERQVQIAIGILLVLKVFFGFTIHELFFAATALIGAGLIVAGTTRWCGMARLIAILPWNRNSDCAGQTTTS